MQKKRWEKFSKCQHFGMTNPPPSCKFTTFFIEWILPLRCWEWAWLQRNCHFFTIDVIFSFTSSSPRHISFCKPNHNNKSGWSVTCEKSHPFLCTNLNQNVWKIKWIWNIRVKLCLTHHRTFESLLLFSTA